MAEELKIVLAVDGADKVAAALDNTSEALKDTATNAKKAGDALNRTLKPGSDQAINTLSNLSRVAQDAPYGIIGIANNINPLVESFQRLQVATKDSGGAFKALIGSLSGPAGIGLAIGVVTSLLVKFGGELFGTNKAIDDTKYKFELFKNEVDKTKNSFDAFVTTVERAQKLNEIDISTKFIGIEADQLKRQANFITISEKLVDAQEKKAKAFKAVEEIIKTADITEEEYQKRREAALSIYNKLDEEERKLIDLREEVAAQNRLAAEEEKRAAKKRAESIDTVAKTLAKLKEDLKDQKALSLTFNTSTLKEQAKLVESAIEKIVTKFNLSPANTLKLKVALLSGNGAALGSEEIGKLLNQLEAQLGLEQFAKTLKPIPVSIPVELKFDTDISSSYKAVGAFLEKQKREAEKIAQQKIADFQSIITEFATSSAIQIGELLGAGLYAAITGQANGIADAFKSLFMLFGDAVQSLGKYAIQYSAAMEGLKKALAGASGLAGIGIGIGLIALGALIKAAIGGIGKVGSFAVGTNFAPGGMALVGERGPELVNLPRGSQVVPAAQTSAMLGGRQNVEVFGVLRGQDIYFSNKRYGQTYNRQT